MKIRTKIALQFTLTVAIILAFFSASIYYLSENYREQEFYKSLKDRALTTAQLLLKVKDIDKKLLKIIDKNTLSTLYAVEVQVFNKNNEVAYANFEADTIYYSPELLTKIRETRYLESKVNDKHLVGLMMTNDEGKDFVVLAKAKDVYGEDKLANIKNTMITGFILSSILTIVFGFVFAGQSLKPISTMNRDISEINVQNLTKKLSTGNNRDEIAQLALNFNEMLDRLQRSISLQKSFVSNASHELRTPLAAIKSEIQIALQQDRTTQEYQQILKTLLIDNQRLIKLTNGLLQLAKYDSQDQQSVKLPTRIDEVLFEVQDELNHLHPDYEILIDFREIPETDDWVTVSGNKPLLNTLFSNLIENACKYSPDHTALVAISFAQGYCIIDITDTGIGIPESDFEKIFQPFYRSQNVSRYKGHGIGLSICKHIVEIHRGQLKVSSKLNKGSTFTLALPYLESTINLS